jgi:hypothetical protein
MNRCSGEVGHSIGRNHGGRGASASDYLCSDDSLSSATPHAHSTQRGEAPDPNSEDGASTGAGITGSDPFFSLSFMARRATSDFDDDAYEGLEEGEGYPRPGLIDGRNWLRDANEPQ